jgi:cell division protease FtsH
MSKTKKNGGVPKKTKAKKDVPSEEWMKNLPPGVKIKRIEVGPNQIARALIYGILVFWGLSALRQMLVPETIERVSLSTAVETIKTGQATEVTVMANEIMIKVKGQEKILVTSKEPTTSITEILQREGVNVEKVNLKVENRDGWRAFWDIMSLVLTIGPVLLILWLFMARQGAGGPGGGVFGFGKSNARIFVKGKQSTTFADVAGVTEAKRDLEEVVDFLKNPEKYRKMGARAPKGVLLIGSAGVGKTLLAKAVAGEANVPFFSMAGSEFMEMLVGVGASRVRDLFATAKKAGKAIIFIDEIDAIGRMRGGGMDGGHSERDQTLNQILVEMDGFEPSTAVVVLAATNRGDLLDPALLRPGRFDRRVVLEMPDLTARRDIIKIHARGKPFDETVDWERVARSTVGFSGAELENMLNEAAIKAARENKTKIGMVDIDEASLKVKLGSEKRREQTDEDKLMTAYHEAGHAIVNHVEELDSVTRISIVSRGMALGFTLVPPKRDMIHQTKSKLIKQMAMAMGGRAAEELVFGDITTGASSDIQHVTRIARHMVTEWGMSEIGPINLGPEIDTTEYGKGWIEPTKVSDTMQSRVDEEIKKLVNTALEKAREVLGKNRKKLDEVAKILVVKETIGEDEFEAMMSPALAKA